MLSSQAHDRIGTLLEVTVARVHVHHGGVDGLAGFKLAIVQMDGGIGRFKWQVLQVMSKGIGWEYWPDKTSGCLESLNEGRPIRVLDLA